MIFSHRFKWVFLAIFYFAPIVDADEWIWAENHPVNSKLPQFSAVGTDGEMLGIDQLQGVSGTLLFFNRSTEW